MSETKHMPLPWRSVITSAYRDGFKEGIRLFAWWKDGVQQVGTTGTTFKEAVAKHIPTEVDCDAYLTEAAKQEIAAHSQVEELIRMIKKAAEVAASKQNRQVAAAVVLDLVLPHLGGKAREVEATLEKKA